MAENGHYWQVEGENASAQIIDNVLSDLSDVLVEGPPIGEEEKIAVIRVPADPDAEPGTKESRDHFKLGEAGGGDIDAEEDQVLVGDGENWAKGNIGQIYSKADTRKSILQTPLPDFEIKSTAEVGNSTYWNTPIKSLDFFMGGNSYFSMINDETEQTIRGPIFSMNGGGIIEIDKFGYGAQANITRSMIQEYVPSNSPMSWLASRIYRDLTGPFGHKLSDDPPFPYLHMANSSTIYMEGASLIKMADGAGVEISGNASVKINGIGGSVYSPSEFGDTRILIENGANVKMSASSTQGYVPYLYLSADDENDGQVFMTTQVKHDNSADFAGNIRNILCDNGGPDRIMSLDSSASPLAAKFVRSKVYNGEYDGGNISNFKNKYKQPTLGAQGRTCVVFGDSGVLNARVATEGCLSIDWTDSPGSDVDVKIGYGANSKVVLDMGDGGSSSIYYKICPSSGANVTALFTPHDVCSLNFAPESHCGIGFTPTYTDIVCQWKSFEAIIESKDGFVQMEGKDHFEALDDTTIISRGKTHRQPRDIYSNIKGYEINLTGEYNDNETVTQFVMKMLITLSNSVHAESNTEILDIIDDIEANGTMTLAQLKDIIIIGETERNNVYIQKTVSPYLYIDSNTVNNVESITLISAAPQEERWTYLQPTISIATQEEAVTFETYVDYTGLTVDDFAPADKTELIDKISETNQFSSVGRNYYDGGIVVSTPKKGLYKIVVEGFTLFRNGSSSNRYSFYSYTAYTTSQTAAILNDPYVKAQMAYDFGPNAEFYSSYGCNQRIESNSGINKKYTYHFYGYMKNVRVSFASNTQYAIDTPYDNLSTEDKNKIYITPETTTNAKVVENGPNPNLYYSTTVSAYRYSNGTHIGADWRLPIQSERDAQDGPVLQLYDKANICLRNDKQYNEDNTYYCGFRCTQTYNPNDSEAALIAAFESGPDYEIFRRQIFCRNGEMPKLTGIGLVNDIGFQRAIIYYQIPYIVYVIQSPQETYDFTQSIYDVITQFLNGADYPAMLTDLGYTVDNISKIIELQEDSGAIIVKYLTKDPWMYNEVLSNGTDPVFEMIGSSELRLTNGASIKAETKWDTTFVTFGGTSAEGEVSFTLAQLKALKDFITNPSV